MITYQNLDPFFHKNAVFFLERSARKSKPHWHDAVEFVYILDGSLEFHLNGEKFTADSGDLVTVNAAEIHAFYPITEKVDYYFLVADDKFFRTNNLYTDTTYFEKKICSSQAQHLFEEIIKETEKADEYSNISTVSVLLSLFIYLNRHHASKREETQLSEQKKITLVRNTLVYLQTHFREKLTVEQVADAMHFSKSYLSHTFKELTHLSLVGYINALRCQHARALILEGASLAGAAAECGFSDLSYFTRVFKKTMGHLPSEVKGELLNLSTNENG